MLSLARRASALTTLNHFASATPVTSRRTYKVDVSFYTGSSYADHETGIRNERAHFFTHGFKGLTLPNGHGGTFHINQPYQNLVLRSPHKFVTSINHVNLGTGDMKAFDDIVIKKIAALNKRNIDLLVPLYRTLPIGSRTQIEIHSTIGSGLGYDQFREIVPDKKKARAFETKLKPDATLVKQGNKEILPRPLDHFITIVNLKKNNEHGIDAEVRTFRANDF